MTNPGSTLFERIGGEAAFTKLVERFYDGIKTDDVLLPMYPQEDLEGAIWRLSFFLSNTLAALQPTVRSAVTLACE